MDAGTLIALAFALAMDAFAVATATGVLLGQVDFRQTFRLSWHFGLFQSLMPIIGWAAGSAVFQWISKFDHWIAFALLGWIGGRMIVNALLGDQEQKKNRKDPTRGGTMVMLSIAVSLDAFAVGLSMAALDVSIWTPVLVIGIVAGIMTVLGLHLGKTLGARTKIGSYAELVGGMVLIAIGAKILIEHGVFS
jgi:manganese efflux pump family protein